MIGYKRDRDKVIKLKVTQMKLSDLSSWAVNLICDVSYNKSQRSCN